MSGRITNESIETLRERSDIVEVISSYVQLKKMGRIFKGLCSFHQEKTPSFTVDPIKGLYHCFGCGAGGDVFTFVQEKEGLNFNESAERLADSFGVQLNYESGGGEARGSRLRLYDVNRAAASFFHDSLMKGEASAHARDHWESRGFTSEDAIEWQIGFAPSGNDTLYRHLLKANFTSKEIVTASLAIVGDRGEHRDRFRGRLMFPIWDISSQVVGFGARALGDARPKYLNSSETPVYQKSKLLFGLDRAKKEMSSEGFAVVTEGYTDVIALHRIGVKTAVATCGTALGEEHFNHIKKFCDRVILAYDADPAGALASERGFELYSKVGLEVLVAPLPEGQDPADFALGSGREAVEEMIEVAKPLMRFVLEAEIGRQRLDTPEGKARGVKAAAAILSRESNRVARGEHAFWVAKRIGINPDQVQVEIAEGRGQGAEGSAQPIRVPGHIKLEREALAICLASPSDLGAARDVLTSDHFTVATHRVLWNTLSESGSSSSSLMTHLPDDETRRLAAQLSLSEITTQDAPAVFRRLEEFRLVRQIDALRATLEELDPADKEYDVIFERLLKLDQERRHSAETDQS